MTLKTPETPEADGPGRVNVFFTRLARLQERRPYPFIAVAFILAMLSIPPIVGIGPFDGLTLDSDFTSMLPESARSVRDLEEIRDRYGGQQPIMITVESSNEEALHGFVRAWAPRIEALDEHQVVAVDWNVREFVDFVIAHEVLYADLSDLREIHDALSARLEYERARANPFFIDLEEEPPPDPEATLRRIEREANARRAEAEDRFPGGFLQHPTRTLVMLVVHSRVSSGDAVETAGLLDALEREAAAANPAAFAPDIEIHYGGPLIEIRDETNSLVDAVRNSTLLTIGLVMVVTFLMFLRIRPIPLLTLALIPPLLLTFAFAEVTVDYLNASSAFLSSIVVGNGINPLVIWLARYFEARRDGESISRALRTSHRGTWQGTLTASFAAAVAYGSLMWTDYRGFRDFGIVGGAGMVLCWFATFLVLPPLTIAFERWRPLTFKKTLGQKPIYGRMFAKVAFGAPRLVLAVSAVITLVAAGFVAKAVSEDPLENDFRNLRSERDPDSDINYVIEASRGILDDTLSGAALAILAPNPDVVPTLLDQLEAYRTDHPRDFGRVRSIGELLPAQQAEKVQLAADLRRVLLEIRPHADEALQQRIDEHLPPEHIIPISAADLPPSIVRPFVERDGTRGRLIFLEHHPEEPSWDAKYMSRWAAAARSVHLPGDEAPPVAGTAVVFADLIETVWSDGPRTVVIALFATMTMLFFTFRRHAERALTLGSLLVGVVWMAGGMALLGMRLNFLNFVAFPITFGIGVDYAVNVMTRYVEEVDAGRTRITAAREAVEGTGAAVILCSLTTIIGYISVHTSSNRALNSFGTAMAISELTCLVVAVVATPALLAVMARRRDRIVAPVEPAPSDAPSSQV